jgi:hypothetical protein
MNSNNSNTNLKKKHEIQKKFSEIIKTVSRINKGENIEMKTFKRNKNISPIKNNNSDKGSIPSSIESLSSGLVLPPSGNNLFNKNVDLKVSKKPSKNKNTINTNNSKKISKTDYGFLLNFLKQKQNNNGQGFFKKMGNRFDGLKTSMGSRYDDFKKSMGSRFEGFKTSMGNSFKDFKKSMDNANKDSNSSMDSRYEVFKTSMGNSYDLFKKSMGSRYDDFKKSMGSRYESSNPSMGNRYKGFKKLMGNSYDSTKQYIVNKTNPEKNVIINISNIKEISKIVKNNFIYIDITNLIGDYNFNPNLNEEKYFEDVWKDIINGLS